MHACERVRVCVPSLGCELRGARLGRQQLRVPEKNCPDLPLLDLSIAVFGDVESGFAVLKRARGVSGCVARAWIHANTFGIYAYIIHE